MARLSVHDHLLISYHVGCQAREITFVTERPPEPGLRVHVRFEGLEAYAFQHDSRTGTIIHSFEQVPAMEIFDQCQGQFSEGMRYGWPGDWAQSAEAAEAFFTLHAVKGWRLHSAIGMTGWILAKSMLMEQL